jgi:dihydropyrimidinase
MYDLVIKNGHCFIDGRWSSDFIYVNDERIALISPSDFPARQTFDAGGHKILPGLIDPHVHFDLDLGSIKSRDDFEYGSRAGVYGGMTCYVDFLAPTHNAKQLEQAFNDRLEQAKKSHIDYHFHATICQPDGDLEQYVLTMKRLGMHTLKLFTTYSDSNRNTSDEHIIELLKLSKVHDILIMAHIEDDAQISLKDEYGYIDLPISRPTRAETDEALKLAGYVKKYGGKLYMVHLSSGRTLEALKNYYPELINHCLFIESCPQYFLLDQSLLYKDDGYKYTCAPPLRTMEEIKLLHKHKLSTDTIATDHCAFNLADKLTPRLKGMPLGIGGIEYSFALMYPIFGDDLIGRMSERPAQLMGLPRKGKIAVGYDADLAIFIDSKDGIVTTSHGAVDHSVYQGMHVAGYFDTLINRGHFIMNRGVFIGGRGQFLKGKPIK